MHVGYSLSITCHGVRLGTVLYKKYGDRLFQVMLHQKIGTLAGKPSHLTRLLERLYAAAGARPLAFDVKGTPFANLTDSQTRWRM